MTQLIAGRTQSEWEQALPLLKKVSAAQEVFWCNPNVTACAGRTISQDVDIHGILDAEERLKRFAPYLAVAFPETAARNGFIESDLTAIPAMHKRLEKDGFGPISGSLYLKCDSHLPISGSVKARGGIYEVLKTAEDIALQKGMLSLSDNYAKLANPEFTKLFSDYSIVVGSTGNLGLSIGIMSAKLGFRVVVHMSADAKQWKKDMLREKGATVVEHSSDYGVAVAAGRKESDADPKSHFVDDENSVTLFLGYAVAARRLQKQFQEQGIKVDSEHPLFVYLPCGVGGAPGGITFGLRTIFGDAVHCFYAEPTHSPALLLGLMTDKHNEVCAQDFGLDNKTQADGLAVGRASGFVGKTLRRDISGCYTVQDSQLNPLLAALADEENIWLEPSAMAGFPGPGLVSSNALGILFQETHSLSKHMHNATHILWATGGGMVPKDIMQGFYTAGKGARS